MKKAKDLIIGFIIGGIIFGIIGVQAATQLEAIGVTYSNKDTSVTNVEEALDELFIKANDTKGGKVLVGTYTGNQTLSLSTLGYPNATADDFLVVITSVPSANKMYYTIEGLTGSTNMDYYNQIGSVGSNPIWTVSNNNLVISGMTMYAYLKNTHYTNNYNYNSNVVSYTWQLYYVG